MIHKEIVFLTERIVRLEDNSQTVKEDIHELKMDIKEIKVLLSELKQLKGWMFGIAIGATTIIAVVWEIIKYMGIH